MATPHNSGSQALYRAIYEGNLREVVALIELGADVNAPDSGREKPLRYALWNDSVTKEIVQALITAGGDVNDFKEDDYPPLKIALTRGKDNKEIVQALIDVGADVNFSDPLGDTLLHEAVRGLDNHMKEVVQTLIAAGADVNAPNLEGDTPLHRALGWYRDNDREETVQALIAAGADVNVRGKSRRPLEMALSLDREKKEIVRALITAGADVNAPGRAGDTPLHLALDEAKDKKEIVQALIAAGADVNAAGREGRTPLHIAAREDDVGMIRALVSAGADLSAQNRGGKSVVDWALENSIFNPIKASTARAIRSALRNSGTKNKNITALAPKPVDISSDGPVESVAISLPGSGDLSHAVPEETEGSEPGRLSTPVDASARPLEGEPGAVLNKQEEVHMPTISIIGAPGSGKSHFATLLYLHLLQHDELHTYIAKFGDARYNIITSATSLRRGIPLEPTPSDMLVRNEIEISFNE